MIRTILVDDEKPGLDELEYLLKKENDITILGKFTNPVEALDEIQLLVPDLVFLDINMPVLNGINIANEINHLKTKIVFVTAYDNFALPAYDVFPVSFILKPIRADKLNNTLVHIRNNMFSINQNDNTFIATNTDNGEKINIKMDGEFYIISLEDILYIEVNLKNTTIVTNNNNYETHKSLNYWEEKLKDKGFHKCHRSYLININTIRKISPLKISPLFNGIYEIKFNNCHRITISKKYSKKIIELLNLSN